MESALKNFLSGEFKTQEAAVNEVSDIIKNNIVKNQTTGLLLSGSSGTGKTRLLKRLCTFLKTDTTVLRNSRIDARYIDFRSFKGQKITKSKVFQFLCTYLETPSVSLYTKYCTGRSCIILDHLEVLCSLTKQNLRIAEISLKMFSSLISENNGFVILCSSAKDQLCQGFKIKRVKFCPINQNEELVILDDYLLKHRLQRETFTKAGWLQMISLVQTGKGRIAVDYIFEELSKKAPTSKITRKRINTLAADVLNSTTLKSCTLCDKIILAIFLLKYKKHSDATKKRKRTQLFCLTFNELFKSYKNLLYDLDKLSLNISIQSLSDCSMVIERLKYKDLFSVSESQTDGYQSKIYLHESKHAEELFNILLTDEVIGGILS